MVLVLKQKPSCTLLAQCQPGTAGDERLCVGVYESVRMRVHVTAPWCTTTRLLAHVIPLNDLFSKQRESLKE